MRDRRASITPPNLAIALSILAGIAFYRVGEGLLTSTVSFEMWGASLPAALIGATGSAFFAGCLIGTLICVRLIERVGVVRTFSVIVLILVGTVLLLILIKHPLSWLMTRLVMGVGAAGFLVIVEAWLDGQTPLARRGKVLSLNFLLYYAAYARGRWSSVFWTVTVSR
ncbi:MAG: MFS transporter [Pseudomonadota bacterium]